MNRFTVRFAHLESQPKHKKGDSIKRGDIVGAMGNTGQSTGEHLHIDCVLGWHSKIYKLSQIASHEFTPCPIQLNYFIDSELFGCSPIVTTWYYDYRYLSKFGKQHPGYDVIPSKDKKNIFWNRSMDGEVLSVGYDAGYGDYIMIGYQT